MIDDDDPPIDDGEEGDDELPLAHPTISAADPKVTREQTRRIKREQREAREFWTNCLGNRIGRREIWRLLQAGHAFETKFMCGPNGFPQPEATWHALGEQAFTLRWYHALCAIDREHVLMMHDENDHRFERFVDTTRASHLPKGKK